MALSEPTRILWDEVIRPYLVQAGRGVHVVYSGLNSRIREYGADPRHVFSELLGDGLITMRPAKGGMVVHLASQPRLPKPIPQKPTQEPTANVATLRALIRDGLRRALKEVLPK